MINKCLHLTVLYAAALAMQVVSDLYVYGTLRPNFFYLFTPLFLTIGVYLLGEVLLMKKAQDHAEGEQLYVPEWIYEE